MTSKPEKLPDVPEKISPELAPERKFFSKKIAADITAITNDVTTRAEEFFSAENKRDVGIKKPHAKAIQRLFEIPNSTVTVANYGSAISVTLGGDNVSGLVYCRKIPNSSLMMLESSGATKGFGPLLYDIAIEEVTKNGYALVSDRARVSDDAYAVWQKFYFDRPDIEKITLEPGEWYDGRLAKEILQKMTEDSSTWPDKKHPIWSLWTGYKKGPSITEELRAGGKLKVTQVTQTSKED